MAGNRTRVDCLEGNHANHYTTIALCDGYESSVHGPIVADQT